MYILSGSGQSGEVDALTVKLAAVVLAKDVANHIGPCLESVSFAGQTAVISDPGPDDGTKELARGAGAQVIERAFDNFAGQRNAALDMVDAEWLFFVDADERVTPELAEEIQTVLSSGPAASGFRVPRVSFYLGRWIRTTDWYPDPQLRLYDRRAARWVGDYVHEHVEVRGACARLRHDLQHLPYRDISHHLQTMDRYTTLAARQMQAEGRRVGAAGLLARPAGAFLRNYLLRSGWRDGTVGLAVSLLNSYYVFLKFAKLWEATRRSGDQSAVSKRC